MEGNPTYLTLKEASARLGVHPNTLRNWERRGLVRLTRLPGSRYRRVPKSEMERLEASLLSSPAPSAGVISWSVRIEPPDTDPAAIAEAQALAESVQAKLAEIEPEMTLEETMQVLRRSPELPRMEGNLKPTEAEPVGARSWGVRLECPPPDDPELSAKAEALLTEIKAAVSKLQDETTLEEVMQNLRGRPWSS
jgi:excisionase family DNA binding protein